MASPISFVLSIVATKSPPSPPSSHLARGASSGCGMDEQNPLQFFIRHFIRHTVDADAYLRCQTDLHVGRAVRRRHISV